jgi:hypothetical protein
MEIDGVATVVTAAGAAVDEPLDPQAARNTRSVAAMITPRNDRNGNVLGGFCT